MKIRILYCIETLKSGGVEQRRYTLSRLLDKNKYDIKIICTLAIGPLADKIRNEGVDVIEIGKLSSIWQWERYKSVLKIIKNFSPHIIHGAVFEGVLLATISGYIGKVPIILAEETSDPITRSKKATKLIKVLSLFSDRFIGVSPAAYEYLISKAKVSPSKIKLINNGVMIPHGSIAENVIQVKKELGLDEKDIVVGTVGRLWNEVKRFTDLIESFYILKDTYPNLKLLIIGDGPDKELIDKYIIDRNLQEQVRMLGFKSETSIFYQLMDVFAIVSKTESFGLVAVEAMYHKLPVIATKVGGLKYIIENNVTGLLVETNSPKQIAMAIEKLILNGQLRFEMGARGYDRAIKLYSAERYVQELDNFYHDLLQEKKQLPLCKQEQRGS